MSDGVLVKFMREGATRQNENQKDAASGNSVDLDDVPLPGFINVMKR
jgi:hypothetical protein